tara:strand:+ start:7557 stop:8462 length:906 start_codon:yes stop_codon:yes gene_type:complete
MLRVLLTGGTGQLGSSIQKNVPSLVNLFSPGRKELDLSSISSCREAIKKYRPDWIINSGAFTSVDSAESNKDLAFQINHIAPSIFSEELEKSSGKILQISTDYVFNGKKSSPYTTNNKTNPISVYGASKLAGEEAILKLKDSKVIRTSWLYGPTGKNFCSTMLRLHEKNAGSSNPLKVVSDQIGCPTNTFDLSIACWRIIEICESNLHHKLPKIFHWSDAGVASWYDFANAIGEIGVLEGLIKDSSKVIPIRTDEYKTAAKRPNYSLLDCNSTLSALKLERSYWRDALRKILIQMKEGKKS